APSASCAPRHGLERQLAKTATFSQPRTLKRVWIWPGRLLHRDRCLPFRPKLPKKAGNCPAPNRISLSDDGPPVACRPCVGFGAEHLLRPRRIVIGHAGQVVDPVAPPATVALDHASALEGLPRCARPGSRSG